jgi:RNA polymerase sigma factor (sigma-70 family)
MPVRSLDPIIPHLRKTALRQDRAAWTDGRLLEQFIADRDAAAFETLVRRHGPMVLGVCRRVVGNLHDAEDAFQAAFLVLARKAASVSPREAVGNWLYGVARTTALRARAANARRRLRERQVKDMPQPEAVRPSAIDELLPLLDDELARLPDKYRLAVVLCDLEGRSRRDAARQLQVPEGTLSSRLTTARRMLAKRLARHGLAVSAATLAGVLAPAAAPASVPAPLLAATVKAACLLATGQGGAAGAAPAAVATLMEGVLKTMLVNKLKIVTAAMTVAVLACCGLGALTREAAGQAVSAPPTQTREGKPSLAHAARDRESLQGVWAVVSVESGGKVDATEKALFLVNGNRACWQTPDEDMQGGLYLDPTSRPKAYDLATSLRTFEGIYELEGDTLRLCYDPSWESKRPRRFATRPGSHQLLIVLKRQPGLDIRDYRLADGSKAFPTLVERPARPQPPPRVAQAPVPVSPPPWKDHKAPPPAPGVKARAPARVGEVILVGNTKTPDAVIRRHLRLLPGQVLDYASLPRAEKALADLKLFVVDQAKGIRPTVVVVEPDDADAPFKDILVTVTELPATQKPLREEAGKLRRGMEQLEQRLSEVQDEAAREALQRQAEALREGLKRLQQRLRENEGSSASPAEVPLGSAPTYGAGLAGGGVVNEQHFDVIRSQVLNQPVEKDFQVAEFYRKTGHPGAAAYYYELVCRRYPGTALAVQAGQRLSDLNSAPAD